MAERIRRPAAPPQVSEQWAMLGAYLAQEASVGAERPNELTYQVAAALRALHHLVFRCDLDWETIVKVANTQVHYDLNVAEADDA